jgi:hypothetical protein
MPYGTLTTNDTLATLRAATGVVADIGEDVAFESIDMALQTHNQLLAEAMLDFVEPTTDRLRRYGGPDQMVMEELDEIGSANAQKIGPGATLGFPMKFYGGGLQWSRLYFLNATGKELAAQVEAMMDADVKNVLKQLKAALMIPINANFEDRRVDHVQLPIKGLVNADGGAIPIAPDGTTFNGATHKHYLAPPTATWASATAAQMTTDVTGLVTTVVEHFLTGKILVLINQAQEANIRSLTSFFPYYDMRLTPAITATQATSSKLDVTNLTNRAIGVCGPAEVWIKPWIPAGYVVAMQVDVPQKALCMRTRNVGSGNLELQFDMEEYPLRARTYGREFGFGVWNRVAAAVLDTADLTTYVAPALSVL